ncbi:MAG: amino acid adenylation domain-containing protein, partial [Acidobacteriota bacterium]
LIGFFVNTLVMRTNLGGDPSFTELLHQVRRTALDAFAHQDVPFEQLVEELQPERSLNMTPLFQVMFTLQNLPAGGGAQLPGLSASGLKTGTRTSKFDLTLSMAEEPQLGGSVEYSLELFDPSTIQRLVRHLQRLAEGIAEDPDRRLSAIPMLAAGERHQLLAEWGSGAPSEEGRNVAQLFDEQVRQRPQAIAVTSREGQLSYAGLDRRAGWLAEDLRQQGAGCETLAGLLSRRSAEMVTGLLAILKAGAAYLPLDPDYPPQRLSFMLDDSAAVLVLAETGLRERLPSDGLPVLALEGSGPKRERTLTGAPGPEADNLAYVNYTSGSTGLPKGVAVTQQAVLRLVRESDYLRFGPQLRIGQAASSSFDALTFEVWGALLNGGCMAVIPRGKLLSPQSLAQSQRRENITTLFLTTALLNQAAYADPQAFQTLDDLLFGGEAVDPTAVRRLLEAAAPVRLLHVYGPTENTTYSTWHRVDSVAENARTVPIGLPLAGSSAFVLDRSGNAVPAGVPGQLCLGGKGLARGYLNRPALTAESFVPDPFAEGGRLYRSGDLVRRRADGAIEFLGRLDDQVKIRGFRIEPGEIEAVLLGHPDVAEAVVVVRDERLVAYLVRREEEEGRNRRERGGRAQRGAEKSSPRTLRLLSATSAVQSPDLRSHLKDRLPEFMVPSAFVTLESMPLTPNGKVDRQVLFKMPDAEAAGERSRAPATPAEELLAGIWCDVLGREGIGAGDSFFHLGGHSLLATQVISRIRSAFGIELPLRTLFQAPTLSELAQRVEEQQQTGSRASAPPLVRVPRDGGLPLSFAQQRLWFLDQMEPDSPAYNIPVALRLTGHLDCSALQAAFQEIVRRHESLRSCFPAQQGEAVQSILPPPEWTLPRIDLGALGEGRRRLELRRLASEQARRPFELAHGPLLRSHLVRMRSEEHALLATLHHIVSDGWSMGVMLREMSALYGAFLQGRPSPLEELPIQYSDFAVWQRNWLAGPVLQQQLDYWKEALAGAAPLELPCDRVRPSKLPTRGGGVRFEWPHELGQALQQLSRSNDSTLFMTLLAGFQALLGRYSGQSDISLGTPIANRTRSETEALIGFFVNTLVLRGNLSGDPSFEELLVRTREAALGAYAHQDLPFERLVEALEPARTLNRTPLFQVMFSFQSAL